MFYFYRFGEKLILSLVCTFPGIPLIVIYMYIHTRVCARVYIFRCIYTYILNIFILTSYGKGNNHLYIVLAFVLLHDAYIIL